MKPEGLDGFGGGMERRPSDDFIEAIKPPDEVSELTPSDVVRQGANFLTQEKGTDEEYVQKAQNHLDAVRMMLDDQLLTDPEIHATAKEIIKELEVITAGKH